MKRPSYPHLLTCALLCAWQVFTALPVLAQSGAGAQAAAIDLDCQGCQPAQESVRLLPGRRVALFGPPGTLPIKGNLLQGGDTITLRSGQLTRRVPTRDVTMVSVNRPYLWLKMLLLHVLYVPYLLVAGIILAFTYTSLGVVLAVLIVPYLAILIPILATMSRAFKIGPWQIRRPLP